MVQSTNIIQSDVRSFPLGNLIGPTDFLEVRREMGSSEALFEYKTIPAVVHIDHNRPRIVSCSKTKICYVSVTVCTGYVPC